MLETYQGVLHGDRIEWSGDAPGRLPPEHGIRVHVTLLDKVTTPPDQGRRMAAALERLAATQPLQAIPDPAA